MSPRAPVKGYRIESNDPVAPTLANATAQAVVTAAYRGAYDLAWQACQTLWFRVITWGSSSTRSWG